MTNIRNHPMAALGVLVLGLFMTLLDLTIVNIAIPRSSTGSTRASTRCCGC